MNTVLFCGMMERKGHKIYMASERTRAFYCGNRCSRARGVCAFSTKT